MEIINFSELKPFFSTFRAESDRACGILSGILLDSFLEILFRKAMLSSVSNNIFSAQGVLGTFSSKIDVAYYLGRISKSEYQELHLIRKIRNDFAHAINHELSFSISPVSDRIQNLQFPKFLLNHNHLADKPISAEDIKEIQEQPRRRFEVAVGTMTHFLDVRVKEVKQPTSPRGILEIAADVEKTATKLGVSVEDLYQK